MHANGTSVLQRLVDLHYDYYRCVVINLLLYCIILLTIACGRGKASVKSTRI